MLPDVLVPVLAFAAVISLGGAIVAARLLRREPLKARLSDIGGGVAIEEAPAGRARSLDAISRLGESVSGGKTSRTLKEQLAQAGYHDPGAPAIYMGAKMALFIAGLVAAVAVLMPLPLQLPLKVVSILLVTGLLSFVPNFVVAIRRSKRRTDVQLHLPDAVDLLEICVSSGMGIDMAWNAVSEEVRRVSTTLGDEMALANLEIHLGAPRADAMRHMADRTGVDDIGSLVATLVQSERFGTSIADALRVFAESLREQRSQRAQEAAEKMAVKLLFPLVLNIFPAMLIVVAGPAFITIYKTMGGGG
jgi:tight adherence protein C